MDAAALGIGLGLGAVLGGAAAWLWARGQHARTAERLAAAERERAVAVEAAAQATAAVERHRGELAGLQARAAELTARLEDERRSAAEKLAVLDQAQVRLADAFRALSADALRANNQTFLDLAQATLARQQQEAQGALALRQQAVADLVAPVREGLGLLQTRLQEAEQARAAGLAQVGEQVRQLAEAQLALRQEAGNLARALRAPHVRGRWGEIQLRRVVELAGMLAYCDFQEQAGAEGEAGRLRPDLLVRLPGGKLVVVDAKTPLAAYLDAIDAPDDATRAQRLADHARQVRDHLQKLGAKGYWEQFQPSPEFVVMFLPGESFFAAALEHDPSLIERGVADRVLPASPTTLIALLRAVAYGWRQEQIAENAQRVHDLGKELHDRLRVLAEHVADAGRHLERAVKSHNAAVASLESRVLPGARRFAELGVGVASPIREVPAIEAMPRPPADPAAG